MIRFGVEGLTISRAVARALLVFASKDETRAMVCSIGIDGGCLVATDGHAALRFEDADREDGAEPPGRWDRRLFLRATVETALAASADGGAVSLPWSLLAEERHRCPQVRQCEPPVGVPVRFEPVGFSAALIGRLEVVARACRRDRIDGELSPPDDPPVVLVSMSSDATVPCRYQVGGEHWPTAAHQAQVTIMPMRLGGDALVLAKARQRVRERAVKAQQREKEKLERERTRAAREEAKSIRARDRAERMPRRREAAP